MVSMRNKKNYPSIIMKYPSYIELCKYIPNMALSHPREDGSVGRHINLRNDSQLVRSDVLKPNKLSNLPWTLFTSAGLFFDWEVPCFCLLSLPIVDNLGVLQLQRKNTWDLSALLHSEQPKLHRVLAVLSAIGLNKVSAYLHLMYWFQALY